MAESHVVSALKKKHARLKGELFYHQQAVERLEKALEATGQSIKLFSPEVRLHHIKAIKPVHRSEHFKQGECSRLVMDVLREAGEPMTAKAVAAEIVRFKGLELDDPAWVAVQRTVVNVLKGLDRRGVTERIARKHNSAHWLPR